MYTWHGMQTLSCLDHTMTTSSDDDHHTSYWAGQYVTSHARYIMCPRFSVKGQTLIEAHLPIYFFTVLM